MAKRHGKYGWPRHPPLVSVDAEKMGGEKRSVKSILNAVTTRGRRLARSTKIAPGEDAVRILDQLTQDVEHFDSMIRSQRELITGRSTTRSAFDEDQMRRQTRLFSAGAAEIVTKAQGALRELRGLSHGVDVYTAEMLEQSSMRQADEQQTG
jgi:hypothetical protein